MIDTLLPPLYGYYGRASLSMKKVTFIEFPVFAGVLPLASGYMQAYCLKDSLLSSSFQFEKISLGVKTPYEEIISTLVASDSDVYAFSCYVWNSKLVRRIITALCEVKLQSRFILGGPQVMHQAASYLTPEHENIFICNGEGERTFAAFLRALHSGDDFATVRNLSFYRGGTLLTTEAEPRISDLSEIPSPFLEGLFEQGQYSWMLLETNRGCPFKCNYCYWGAATGARVYQFDEHRLKQEITWISQSKSWYLFIADANWGMLKRDVELSRFIVECQQRNGAPLSIYFCGSKNTPDRVAEITRIYHDANMISTHSVALQTMHPETLIKVNRSNIKTSAYTQLQQSLNQQGIASFVEMIWPLPGETLDSFQEGLAKLCEVGADSFVIYPLLLMNNVELGDKREEYGLQTIPDPDPNSEAEIVTETSQVDMNAYREGLRYMYAVETLHVLRGLWHLGRYLNAKGTMPYKELFSQFVKFAQTHPSHPWTHFCENSIAALEHATFSNTGALVHLILHSDRETFDTLLEQFAQAQNFWNDPVAEFLFEVDLIHRPYVYRNTPIVSKRRKFRYLRVVDVHAKGYVVEVPSRYAAHLREYGTLMARAGLMNRFEVNHRRLQLPFTPSKSLHEHFVYCQDMSQRMMSFLPAWQTAASTGASLAVR
jgi:radical SAM superfamily enzyme YgiQ (UPF0313 family)